VNPILLATLEHLEAGHKITRITVDKRVGPSKVIFEFADGTNDQLAVECDHSTFMRWWKRMGSYIRGMAHIRPLDDVEEGH
jgi:hypothetical protein